MARSFPLTMQVYGRLKSQMNEKFVCAGCGEKFEPFDNIISHKSQGKVTRYYHFECHEKLFLTV